MDNITLAKNIIKYLLADKTIKKFKYYNAFRNKWERTLLQHARNNIHYTVANISDDDQLYKYQVTFMNDNFTFNFNIPYLKNYLNFDKDNKKLQLEYKNNKLMYNKYQCIFTKYNENECLTGYDDYDGIIACLFPSTPYSLVIVDGNHRLSKLINNGEKFVTVNYINEQVAHRALSSPFEIAIYCCLIDYEIIKNNIKSVPSSQLKEQLFIFNENSLINNLESRKISY